MTMAASHSNLLASRFRCSPKSRVPCWKSVDDSTNQSKSFLARQMKWKITTKAQGSASRGEPRVSQKTKSPNFFFAGMEIIVIYIKNISLKIKKNRS